MDDALHALYRALPRNEPPASIDAAVLAAARRSVESKPSRRWAAPVGLAAVLVLSVGVTLRVAEERPDAQLRPEVPPPQSPVATAPAKAPAEAPAASAAKPESAAPAEIEAEQDSQRTARASRERAMARQLPIQQPRATEKRAETPPAADQPPITFVPSPQADSAQPSAPAMATSPGAAAQSAPLERPAARAEARPAAPSMGPAAGASDGRAQRLSKSASAEANLAAAAAQTPEAWLERIARMRAEGRHKEADESYAEFRRQHPGYAIAPQMLEKIAPSR